MRFYQRFKGGVVHTLKDESHTKCGVHIIGDSGRSIDRPKGKPCLRCLKVEQAITIDEMAEALSELYQLAKRFAPNDKIILRTEKILRKWN